MPEGVERGNIAATKLQKAFKQRKERARARASVADKVAAAKNAKITNVTREQGLATKNVAEKSTAASAVRSYCFFARV